jgi:hypothetical protein
MYFSMTDIRYGKSLTITNIQMIITEIWFWPYQFCKIRCDMLISTDVRKPIGNTCWENIAQRQICTRLLSMSMELELRTVRGCMTEGLA